MHGVENIAQSELDRGLRRIKLKTLLPEPPQTETTRSAESEPPTPCANACATAWSYSLFDLRFMTLRG